MTVPTNSPTTSPRDAGAAASSRCPICLHAVDAADATTGDNCSHEHCLQCLRQWTSTRQNPKCPICQADIAVLRCTATGLEENIIVYDGPPPHSQDHDAPPDLACLDHAFFSSEATRLLRRAQNVQARLASDRRRNADNDAAALMLGDAIRCLEEKKKDMDDEIPFIPEDILQELYSLDEAVCSISTGSWMATGGGGGAASAAAIAGGGEGRFSAATTTATATGRLSAADAAAAAYDVYGNEEYWHDDDEEDDDDDDDYYGDHHHHHHDDHQHNRHYHQVERLARMTISATPGKKPSSRRRKSGASVGAVGGGS